MSFFGNEGSRSRPTLQYATPDAYGQQSSLAVAAFFNAVYGWMCAGLALTAGVAWYVSSQPQLMKQLLGGPIIILFIVELALVFTISNAINKINATVATMLFLVYAAINGAVLSILFLVYAHAAILGAFVATAGMFGAMSVYGFVTRRDLSRMGSILFMALIGLILATLVNCFMASSALYWLCTYAGILIFCGLTAFDTQRLRNVAMQVADPALASRLAISGALMLYLDFINLFIYMLRILGDRRS